MKPGPKSKPSAIVQQSGAQFYDRFVRVSSSCGDWRSCKIRLDAKKKRPAFSAERFCAAQRMRYSISINSGSPGQITRSVYTKPSTSTATQQVSTKTK